MQTDQIESISSEQKLEALNIILNKQVDMDKLICILEGIDSFNRAQLYNADTLLAKSLTKKEFDLLEKVYLNYKDQEN